MKILYDFQNMIGGAPRSQLAHMLTMKQHGHKVVATIGEDFHLLEQKINDIKIIKIKNFNVKKPIYNIINIIQWLRLLHKEKPDIIHANRPIQSQFLAIVSDWFGLPFIFAQAGGQVNSNIQSLKGKIAIVYSLENKKDLIKKSFSPNKIHIISNRIFFNNRAMQKNYKFNNNLPLKILLIGNFKKETISGLIKFFELIKNVNNYNKPFLIQIVGKDITKKKIYEDFIIKKIKSINNVINNVGYIKHFGWVEDLEKLEINSHVCIGKGRSIIQPAMRGKICFVLSENGKLTRINNKNLDKLYEYNFSGRGKQNDNTQDLYDILENNTTYKKFYADAIFIQKHIQKLYLATFAYPKLLKSYNMALQTKKKPPIIGKINAIWGFLKIYFIIFFNKLGLKV